MDIKSLIKQGESEITEFKEKFDNETIETIVAFANAKGGIVLIGISDKKEIKGVNIGKETLKDWVNRIFQLEVLKKLELIKNNKPTWASILLFGKNPQGFMPQAKIHCGRFKDEITIIDDELIEGNIIEQVNMAMEFIKKHLKLEFKITGEARRKELWEYPLEAVREAVINAICHRDYTEGSDIQIRIYDDKLIVWNPGKLPLGITIEDLFKPHNSIPRNRLIAQVFFDIGLIEKWGTGIERMVKACKNQGLPEPRFEEYQGFRVIFMKDIYTEDYLKNLALNERQVRAILHLKKKGRITNREYQVLNKISRETAKIELNTLIEKRILIRAGKGRGIYYILG